MQILKAAVSAYYIFIVFECGNFHKQSLLVFEVLFEIVVAQLLIYFKVVGIALACFLEALPHGSLLGCGHFAGSVELFLQLAIAGEGAVHVVGILGQSDDFVDNFILTFKIGSTESLLLGGPLCFLGT